MEARELVANHVVRAPDTSNDLSSKATRTLVSQLEALTGNPRDACFRFVRRFGLRARQNYQEWSQVDQDQLLELIVLHPPAEVADLMHRSTRSIRSMLHKLGSSAQTARNWFTKFTLASALHTRADEVQKWIDQGSLKARVVDTGRLKKVVIDPDDFAQFCKQCRKTVVGRRFNAERLDFVQSFVFSPGHNLPQSESKAYGKGTSPSTQTEASPKTKEREESGSSCTVTM